MIEQNHAHPDYDPDNELLITLDRWAERTDRAMPLERGALLKDLRADLWPPAYATYSPPQAPVRQAIERLRERGYKIIVRRRLAPKGSMEPRGNEAGIHPDSWKQAQADGWAYVVRVYRNGGYSVEGFAKMVDAWAAEADGAPLLGLLGNEDGSQAVERPR